MSKIYSLYILVPGKDKPRSRELGIATSNKDKASLTLHFDVAVPIDPATGYPAKVFLREIERKQEPAPVQQELELAGSQ